MYKLNVTANQIYTYEVDFTSAREEINIFLRSQAGICQICLDEGCTTENQLDKFQKTGKKTYIYESNKILLMNKKFYMQISSTQDEELMFVAQHGIVINEDSFSTGSKLLDDFRTDDNIYQFMKFIGNTDGITVESALDDNQNDTVICYSFDGTNQYENEIDQYLTEGDNSYDLNVSMMNNYPGYCFYKMYGQSITVSHYYRNATLEPNQKYQTQHNYPFVESLAYSKVLVDVTKFSTENYSLAIVATSDSPSIYKFATLYVSSETFFGTEFASNGTLRTQDDYFNISFTGGLNLDYSDDYYKDMDNYKWCYNTTHCYLFITSSFDAFHFYLESEQAYYQPLQVNAFILENALYIHPQFTQRHITASLNQQVQTYIFNMGLLKGEAVNNSLDDGYTFSLSCIQGQQVSKAIVNVNSISVKSGVYLSSINDDESYKQIMISSQINKQYFIKDQMYFLMVEGQENTYGQISSIKSYQVDNSKLYYIRNFLANNDINMFANVQQYKNKYQVCFTWEGDSNMSIYMSNEYEIPSSLNNMYDTYNDTIVKLNSGANSICCTNNVSDNYWSYFRIQNEGENVSGYVTFGEYLHQYASLPVNQPTQLTFYDDYPGLKTTSNLFTTSSITLDNLYFEATFDTPLTENAVIKFTDANTNVIWYQLNVSANQSYCNCIFEAPANKQLLIQMENSALNKYDGKYYIGSVINEKEILNVITGTNQQLPLALLKYQPYEYQYPVITFAKDAYDVSKLVAFVCENKPQLTFGTANQGCYSIPMQSTNFDTLILPLDLNYTVSEVDNKYKGVKLSSQPYYVTIFYNATINNAVFYTLEVYYAQTLTSNEMNGIKLIPSTSAEIYNVNWFSLDTISVNEPFYNIYSYIQFDQTIDDVCVSLDSPVSYLEYKSDQSRCIEISQAVTQINIEIDKGYLYYYRRIYYNIMVSTQVISQIQQIYTTNFIEFKPNNQQTVEISPSVTRAGEDTLQFYVNVQNTDRIQVINQLSTTINDYSDKIKEGTSKYTRLLVSDYQNPTLENSDVDDTIAIQVIDRQLKWQNYQFIQIQPSKTITETVKLNMYVYTDSNIQMDPLQFLQQLSESNVPAEQLKSLYFEASHTPSFILYEVCSAQKGGKFETFSSPVVIQPSLKTISDRQTTILDDSFNGYVIQQLPVNISDSKQFTNLNYFFSSQFNDSEISYKVMTSDGILRPVLPDQQEVYVQIDTDNKYNLLFRPATLPQQSTKYDEILDYGLDDISTISINYLVYTVNQEDITDKSITNTLCGLELVGKQQYQFTVSSESEEQIQQQIVLENVTDTTMVILVAQSSLNYLSTVYKPVYIEFVTSTVDETALICGIVFGILGVIIIGIIIYFIVRYSKVMKQRRIYGSLDSGEYK